MNNLKRLYIACFRFPHRHGHGIHSPFAFDLITSVLYERYPYYAYEELCEVRGRIPGSLPRYSKRVDELLFRLVNRFQPERVVEVGTGSGLSILYMAAAKKSARYMTMDGWHDEAVEALLEEAGVKHRTSVRGAYFNRLYVHSDPFPPECPFLFDGENFVERKMTRRQYRAMERRNHRRMKGWEKGEREYGRRIADRAVVAEFKDLMQNISSVDLLHIAHTREYEAVFEEALKHVSSRSLVIVEGIYESKAKQAWWKRVVADSRTGATFDLYEMGLVFFDASRPKQHYIA